MKTIYNQCQNISPLFVFRENPGYRPPENPAQEEFPEVLTKILLEDFKQPNIHCMLVYGAGDNGVECYFVDRNSGIITNKNIFGDSMDWHDISAYKQTENKFFTSEKDIQEYKDAIVPDMLRYSPKKEFVGKIKGDKIVLESGTLPDYSKTGVGLMFRPLCGKKKENTKTYDLGDEIIKTEVNNDKLVTLDIKDSSGKNFKVPTLDLERIKKSMKEEKEVVKSLETEIDEAYETPMETHPYNPDIPLYTPPNSKSIEKKISMSSYEDIPLNPPEWLEHVDTILPDGTRIDRTEKTFTTFKRYTESKTSANLAAFTSEFRELEKTFTKIQQEPGFDPNTDSAKKYAELIPRWKSIIENH